MMIYFLELPLQEGFIKGKLPKANRCIDKLKISICSGFSLFDSQSDKPIRCWRCSCEADRWIVTKGRTDHVGYPVLNLYTKNKTGQLILMTQDHIIPKSLGGMCHPSNLRVACEICNSHRGNKLDDIDLDFLKFNTHLISKIRALNGLKRMQANIAHMNDLDKDLYKTEYYKEMVATIELLKELVVKII